MIERTARPAPRICVFGAGAVGGYVAARLARGGANVSLVARGAHLAAIRADGLRVEAADGVIEERMCQMAHGASDHGVFAAHSRASCACNDE